jgi:hypothetical protein
VILILLICAIAAAQAQDVPGWRRVGSDREHFDISLDREIFHSGKAAGRLECNQKLSRGTGTLEQDFSPDEYIGKRIRVTAWIKGEKTGEALTFLRVEDRYGEIIQFTNTHLRGAAIGTLNWKKQELVLDVPAEAGVIQFGLLLMRQGKAWMDDVSIEIVPSSVKSTAISIPRRVNPRRAGIFVDHTALNLDFEQ